MTGVMIRSAANFEAGAKSRVSTIVHGNGSVLCHLLPALLKNSPGSPGLGLGGNRLATINIKTLVHELKTGYKRFLCRHHDCDFVHGSLKGLWLRHRCMVDSAAIARMQKRAPAAATIPDEAVS